VILTRKSEGNARARGRLTCNRREELTEGATLELAIHQPVPSIKRGWWLRAFASGRDMSATEEALNSPLEGCMWGPERCEEHHHAVLRLYSSLHSPIILRWPVKPKSGGNPIESAHTCWRSAMVWGDVESYRCDTNQHKEGRPRCKWTDNVKTDLLEIGLGSVDWIGLA
jgi:hypothetical protein